MSERLTGTVRPTGCPMRVLFFPVGRTVPVSRPDGIKQRVAEPLPLFHAAPKDLTVRPVTLKVKPCARAFSRWFCCW